MLDCVQLAVERLERIKLLATQRCVVFALAVFLVDEASEVAKPKLATAAQVHALKETRRTARLCRRRGNLGRVVRGRHRPASTRRPAQPWLGVSHAAYPSHRNAL